MRKRRHGEREARDPGDRHGGRKRQPETQAGFRRQDADRVGADRVERHMTERNLSGKPEQHVEADADDRREADERDDENLVAVGFGDRKAERGQRQHNRDDRAGRHTFFTSARPNSPLGRTASARITSANVTIWV